MVRLTAYGKSGRLIQEEHLPVQVFYEKSHPALDDPSYRKNCGMVRLSGVIYSAQGTVTQEFELRFDAAGLCVCDAARFADGSVSKDWESLQHCER